jgi:hypothetical protein
MEIQLRHETRRLLEEKLQSGPYKSTDELLHAALVSLDNRSEGELDAETLDAIDRAEEAIAAGRVCAGMRCVKKSGRSLAESNPMVHW